MEEMANDLLMTYGYAEAGWEALSESTLLTPNGHVIEWDGISPDGEVSPLRECGLI